MAAAIYNIETVDAMRRAAKRGVGLHELSSILGWDVERTRKLGKHHGIEIREETPDEVARIKKLRIAATAVTDARAVSKVHRFVERAAFDPLPPKKKPHIRQSNGRRARLSGHPRIEYTTLAISAAAKKSLLAQMKQYNIKSLGSIAGIVLDYVARSEKLCDLVGEAMSEIKSA